MALSKKDGELGSTQLVEVMNGHALLALITSFAGSIIFYGDAGEFSYRDLIKQKGMAPEALASVGTLLGDRKNYKFTYLFGEPQANELVGYTRTIQGLDLMVARLNVLIAETSQLKGAQLETRS